VAGKPLKYDVVCPEYWLLLKIRCFVDRDWLNNSFYVRTLQFVGERQQ